MFCLRNAHSIQASHVEPAMFYDHQKTVKILYNNSYHAFFKFDIYLHTAVLIMCSHFFLTRVVFVINLTMLPINSDLMSSDERRVINWKEYEKQSSLHN